LIFFPPLNFHYYGVRVVAPGYLLFVQDGTLMAQPFDTGKLETTGDAVPVAEQVDVYNAGVGVAVGYFSASQNGVLAYTSGRAIGNVQLTWFDRSGKKLDTAGAPGQLGGFSLSPDGTSVGARTQRSPSGPLRAVDTRLGARCGIAVGNWRNDRTMLREDVRWILNVLTFLQGRILRP